MYIYMKKYKKNYINTSGYIYACSCQYIRKMSMEKGEWEFYINMHLFLQILLSWKRIQIFWMW